jgi:predicted exporter
MRDRRGYWASKQETLWSVTIPVDATPRINKALAGASDRACGIALVGLFHWTIPLGVNYCGAGDEF